MTLITFADVVGCLCICGVVVGIFVNYVVVIDVVVYHVDVVVVFATPTVVAR